LDDHGVVLRGYREGDLDAMFRLDEVCFEAPFRFSRASMRRFAEARRARVVIAELDGELLGFCIVHVERESVGYVVTLDVAAEHRRSGVATRLMERGEAEARAVGCSSMALHVFTGNEAAIKFYERMGYGFWRDDKDFYGVGVDALIYRKGIAG
jgi:ribosomal-protein-alanine N-acetyltransferase